MDIVIPHSEPLDDLDFFAMATFSPRAVPMHILSWSSDLPTPLDHE